MASQEQEVQEAVAVALMVQAIRSVPRRHSLRHDAAVWKATVFVGHVYAYIMRPVQIVIREMCEKCSASPSSSWKTLFKDLSYQGYDVRHGRTVDYGNREMSILLWCLRQDDYINQCLAYLSTRWPSLSSNAWQAWEVQGDVIEICIAAFRAHVDYRQQLMDHGYTNFPELLNKMVMVCRAIHWLDGAAYTDRIKYDGAPVRDQLRMLDGLRHSLPAFDEFLTRWKADFEDVQKQGNRLNAIWNSTR